MKMSQAKMTLIGFNNFLESEGSDLFLHLNLPTGIDVDAVKTNILLKGGEFEVLYANPYFLRDSIVTWSKKWHWTFDKWYKAINISYNPLENYDRIEEWTDINSNSTDRSIGNNTTQTNDIHVADSGVNTSENLVSAFDSTSYSPHDKTQATAQSSSSNTGTITNAGTINEGVNESGSNSHNGRMHGNIGVTTSQQMLQSEIDIAMFNLYDRITDVFLQEYVLPIY